MAGGPWPRKVYRSTLNPSLPSACPEPGNPGEHFRPDGQYLRSACVCLLGPSGRHPSPDSPPPEQKSLQAERQTTWGEPRVRRLPGVLFYGIRAFRLVYLATSRNVERRPSAHPRRGPAHRGEHR